MMQNLENKMELQIDSLKTRVKKTQERFNNHLEEIKKESIYNECNKWDQKHSEGTNSRITEAEDRISEVEDRMLEINETEEKRELNEHWGTRVSFSSGFLGVYAQEWDCWVISRWMDKKAMAHIHNGILLSH